MRRETLSVSCQMLSASVDVYMGVCMHACKQAGRQQRIM
jgi:hypothetical protein